MLQHNCNTENELLLTKSLLNSCLHNHKNNIIYAVDNNYKYTIFNSIYKDSIKEQYGNDIKIGDNVFSHFKNENHKKYLKTQIDKALQGESISVTHEDNNWNIFEIYLSPIFNDDNFIIGATIFAQNITEQVKSKQLLQQSEEKYRTVIEGTQDWITIVDSDGYFTFSNHMSKKLFGIDPHNIIGQSAFLFVHPQDKKKTSEWFEKCISKQIKTSSFKNRQISPSGNAIYMFWTCTFTYEENGKLAKVSGIARNITKVVLAEEELKKNERKLSKLIQNLNAGIVVHGADTHIEIANDEASKLLGISKDQMVGKVAMDPDWYFLHENGSKLAVDEYPVSLVFNKKRTIKNMILGINRPHTHDIVWVLVNGFPEFNENEEITQAVITFVDITEVKLIRAKLHQNEIFFQESQRAALIGSYKAEFYPGDTWESSDVCDQILGIEKKENKKISEWADTIHPDYRSDIMEYVQCDVIGKNRPFNREYKIVRQNDHQERWVLGLGKTITNFNGDVTGLIGTIQDITHRKTADQIIFNLQTYLLKIIDSMPSILIAVNDSYCVTQWNKAAEDITNTKREFAIGQSLEAVFPFLTKKINFIKTSIDIKQIKKDNLRIVNEQNKTNYYEITIYPLVSNEISGAVIRIDNRTNEHMLEAQLSQSRKMDAIGQLAGGVAHDFNNMLTGILSAAQLLQSSNSSLNERSLKYVEMIIKASTRASELTNQLLSFGRKGDISTMSYNIHDIINDTYALMERTIDKRINITINKLAENPFFQGDNSAIQNVIMNLVINSSHAMENGGDLSISTSNIYLDENYCKLSNFDLTPGEYIEIEVRDTGTGISPEIIERIFEPFFTTKTHGKGTGLGLASSYGTVKNHNGFIKVYSELEQGTVFHIAIPCSVHKSNNNKYTSNILHGIGTILLVDDEDIIRQTSRYILEDMGYTVLVAGNGVEAVEIYKKEHENIDLVITDMIMPKMNGAETFYKMKEIDEHCKVIISSGFTKGENLAELKENGLLGFIQKPFRNVELSRLISEVMNIEESM